MVDTAASDRETKWGAACVVLWMAMQTKLPGLDVGLNVGKDEAAAVNAPPLITFLHDGESPTWPFRGAGGGGPRHIYDRNITLDVECWGRTAAEAETIFEGLLRSTNLTAHGRASKLGQFQPQEGTRTGGNLGTKWIGRMTIRLAVNETAIRTARATSHGETVVAQAGDELAPSGEEQVLA